MPERSLSSVCQCETRQDGLISQCETHIQKGLYLVFVSLSYTSKRPLPDVCQFETHVRKAFTWCLSV